MADATQYALPHKELVVLLVKHFGVHEGLWQLSVTFGLGAGHMAANPGATPTATPSGDLNPVAFVAVGGVGIRRVEQENSLTVNAAEVNPRLGSIEDSGAGVGTGIGSSAESVRHG